MAKNDKINYSNKEFNSLRNDLQKFALTHFSDNIVDFSNSSLGGMFLDVAAYVGDVTTYYLDHQFNENSIENAIEPKNLERLIRESGVDIPGPSPAYAEVNISIVVSAVLTNGEYIPDSLELPIILKNTIFTTQSGIDFTLLEDVDFNKTKEDGELLADIKIGNVNNNTIINFVLTLKGIVSSAKIATEQFAIENRLVPFRTLSLTNQDVVEIVSVIDSAGDNYYQVDSLSQDTVFKYFDNSQYDLIEVPFRVELLHAPKRFTANRSIESGLTTLRFGAGNENNFDEDIIPDPSEHAISLYGDKETLDLISIDPNSFLDTQTLGISPKDTTLTITYQYGGGLRHNVPVGSISSIKTLLTSFKEGTSTSSEVSVRNSISVINTKRASGGEDEPTLEDLREIAIFNRNSQSRIVTREDLIARVYSMPAKFGRIYRVAVADNPRNPRAAQIFIVSRDNNGKLILSTDTLKKNLSKYLREFRIVSDSIDILDAIIVNFGVNYKVTIDKGYRREVVLNAVNAKLIEYFDLKNSQINKPITIGEVTNLIQSIPGVITIINLNIVSKSGFIDGVAYGSYSFSPSNLTDRGYLFPPIGGIFEIKYPNSDIIGRVG